MRRPYYFMVDSITVFLGGIDFYLNISNGGLLGLLLRTAQNGRNYRKFLSQYPYVCCEPLEDLYQLRRRLNALDTHVLMDLLFCYSWREANVGALLAALAPSVDCIELLQEVKPRLPHGTKIVALALASCGEALPEELSKHFQLLQEIRAMLTEIPHEPLPLRRNYSLEQEKEFNRLVPALRERYPKISEPELPQVMQEIGYDEFMLSHKQWLMKHHPGNMYCRLTRHLQWQRFLVRHYGAK